VPFEELSRADWSDDIRRSDWMEYEGLLEPKSGVLMAPAHVVAAVV